jgi:hypothetical protein
MSCGELERLFVAGASGEALLAHRSACGVCAQLGTDLDRIGALVSDLRPPAAGPALREALLSVPRRTVSCEDADRLIAWAIEGELAPADRERLDFHRPRCEGCGEAAAALVGMRELTAPAPAPWLSGHLVATRPRRDGRPLRGLFLNPRAAIGLAYAAAVVVMLAGFNPADIARKAGVDRLGESARASVQVAGNSLADRVGAFEENAMRNLAVWRGQITGYGRAALSTALSLVMKSEPESPPSRPRGGEESSRIRKYEMETVSWRA